MFSGLLLRFGRPRTSSVSRAKSPTSAISFALQPDRVGCDWLRGAWLRKALLRRVVTKRCYETSVTKR